MKKKFVITGVPGVGKTTLVKKLCDSLILKGVDVRGFVTEEVRESRQRIGFDVVSLDGTRGKLARTEEKIVGNIPKAAVGRYRVFVDEFERLSLPILEQKNGPNSIIVIDEVGKMEMFSQKFKTAVTNILNKSDGVILLTIPVKKGQGIPLVESIRTDINSELIVVNENNRNFLENDLLLKISACFDVK